MSSFSLSAATDAGFIYGFLPHWKAAAFEADLVLQPSPCEKVINILQGCLCDVVDRLPGEEALM